MTVQSKSQRFANAVFPNVQEIAAGEATEAAKYKTLCKKAGALVRNSGLMQTLAFFQARAQKDEHFQKLTTHLEKELCQLNILSGNSGSVQRYLFDHVRSSSVPRYMYLTREILKLLNWHKRLSDTLIIVNNAGGDDNDPSHP
ncbi:MAG: type III-B CRISPR module-associated protein Cmr5 [Desulfamplus sp.]|nr:type III-B CRISPR module-associated protein Cmr5 [Desulfamplus sp.]